MVFEFVGLLASLDFGIWLLVLFLVSLFCGGFVFCGSLFGCLRLYLLGLGLL